MPSSDKRDGCKIEAAALRWIEARVESDKLRDARNWKQCLFERDDGACWKFRGEDPDTGNPTYRRDPQEWCRPCRERQEIHDRYVVARRLTTGRLAALHRLCKAEYRRLDAEIVPPALPGEIETTGEEKV